jgi:BirA family biotin operon repressor/biotin-[acetyl-CoA-carboxylase] ligase
MSDDLSAERIRSAIASPLLAKLRGLTVLEETKSTNAALARLPATQQHAHVVLAECQTGGRGRRQRAWYSPAGGNIYMSLGWRFESGQTSLSTLPLVVAICVSQALRRTGLVDYGIKWPNDILADGKKLAGILVEMQSTGSEPVMAVIGIGLNVSMPATDTGELEKVIDRPWTDLESQLPPEAGVPDRNQLISLMLEALLPALEQFETSGFEPFTETWQTLDLLDGKRVLLDHAERYVAGIGRGVDADGGLLLEIEGQGLQAFHSGEVRVHHD